MNTNFKIENAKKEQVEELLQLSKKVTNHNSRQFLQDEQVNRFINSEFFISEVVDNISNMKIIKDGDAIIGLCVWVENELVSLMIDPDYQGKGAAIFFLETMTQEKLSKYSEVVLECFASNLRANAFYKKLNWIIYDTYLDEDLSIMKNKYKKSI